MKKFTLFLSLLVFFTVQLTKAQTPADTVGAGNALEFNGNSGNYIDLGTTFKSLNFPFSFEAWVYPTSYPSVNANLFITDLGSNYCGFESFMNPSGNVYFIYGNDQSGGPSGRFGYYSSGSLPLNTWSHIAIVCNSASDVAIYINGVSQALNSDGGTANITSLIHNDSYIAAIGSTAGNDWSGQLDEMRVWTIALSQTYVQNTMCSKIDPSTSGLLAYWRADEAETDYTVKDFTTNGINGTLMGTIDRQISDAPIGNTSTDLYTSNFNGESLQLPSSTGDMFTVSQISGDPDGVQLYAVNTAPTDTFGLKSNPTSYFGVFCVNGSSPSYSVSYNYSLFDGMVNNANQDSVSLSTRLDATYVPWLPLYGLLNTAQKTVTKQGQGSPQEYALNVPRVWREFFNYQLTIITYQFIPIQPAEK